ncbi:PLAT domain-containing protein 3-like [Momordica charantia]|uniref:PLAT domain-containing protein 3-like n=1 Tax=Momordica charantia TaxID=3673 RepID=A0A6J1BY14_MOMCH|nr:PLAT domain-containing protein 3-like [Momordica charantia]
MASKSLLPFLILSVLLLPIFSTVSVDGSLPDDGQGGGGGGGGECAYVIYVQTGTVKKAGTHSTISLELKTGAGEGISIPNLEEWGGIMGPNYNFFETGRLDTFTGRGPCLTYPDPICSLNLTSDASGPYHDWYCDYVEVTVSAPAHPCTKQRFSVDRWLARDREPFTLTAIVDYCPSANANANRSLRFD